MRGTSPGNFGLYELAKTLNWPTLLMALALAFAAWFLSDVVPSLEGLGGFWATIAALAVPIVKGLILRYTDNTEKRL